MTDNTETRYCDKEGAHTEWRQYREGVNAAGDPVFRWRCRSCLNKADRKVGADWTTDEAALDYSEVIAGWNVWVRHTGCSEAALDSKFVQTYGALRTRGHSAAEIHEVIDAAAYLPCDASDPGDTQRLIAALVYRSVETKAKAIRKSESERTVARYE